MKNVYFVLFFCVFAVSNAFACFNMYVMFDKKGDAHTDNKFEAFAQNFNPKEEVFNLNIIMGRFRAERVYVLLSDYALQLIKLGKKAEALKIFQELYNHFPNEYKLAANLGTAYELNGMNREALTYIKRGMELNPNAHGGSEWVHVKILETKILMETDSLFLEKNSVLQLTEAQKNDSLVLKHIEIQVRERFPFSPGPDKIMASIFNDLGDCYMNQSVVEYARVIYKIAQKYFGANASLIEPKIKRINEAYKNFSTEKIEKPVQFTLVVEKYLNYKKYLMDNSVNGYSIDWSSIQSDPTVLLKMVDYSLVEINPDTTEIQDKKPDELQMPPVKKDVFVKKTRSMTKIYLFVLVFLAVTLFLLFKPKSS